MICHLHYDVHTVHKLQTSRHDMHQLQFDRSPVLNTNIRLWSVSQNNNEWVSIYCKPCFQVRWLLYGSFFRSHCFQNSTGSHLSTDSPKHNVSRMSYLCVMQYGHRYPKLILAQAELTSMPNVYEATNALNTNENTRQLYFHTAPHSLTPHHSSHSPSADLTTHLLTSHSIT